MISDDEVKLDDRWKWSNSYNAFFNTRFMVDLECIDIGIENYIYLNQETEFYCKTVGVVTCEWKLPDGTKYNGLRFKKIFSLKEGYY